MEKELYRINLEAISKRFGDKQFLPLSEVADYLGVNFRTLLGDKTFPVRKNGRFYGVFQTALASWMS